MREAAVDTQAWTHLLIDGERQAGLRTLLARHPQAQLILPGMVSNELCRGAGALEGLLALGSLWREIGYERIELGEFEKEILAREIRSPEGVPHHLLPEEGRHYIFEMLGERASLEQELARIRPDLGTFSERRARAWDRDRWLRQARELPPDGDFPGLRAGDLRAYRDLSERELEAGDFRLGWHMLGELFPDANVPRIKADPATYPHCHTWVALAESIIRGNLIGDRSTPMAAAFRPDSSSLADAQIATAAARADFLVTEDTRFRGRCDHLREMGILRFRAVGLAEFLDM